MNEATEWAEWLEPAWTQCMLGLSLTLQLRHISHVRLLLVIRHARRARSVITPFLRSLPPRFSGARCENPSNRYLGTEVRQSTPASTLSPLLGLRLRRAKGSRVHGGLPVANGQKTTLRG